MVNEFDLLVLSLKMNKCHACCTRKTHSFPYDFRKNSSVHPLELIYADIQGPAPMKSVNDARYYVLFVNDATKFNWWFSMKKKSDVLDIFIIFMNQIKKQLDQINQQIQMYNGNEFLGLKQFLEKHRIGHYWACPHTHQQMGVVERRHHHIIDMGLMLLNQASLQHEFWSFAFAIVAFLYNQMMTDCLVGDSPYKRLYHQERNLRNLQVFEC